MKITCCTDQLETILKLESTTIANWSPRVGFHQYTSAKKMKIAPGKEFWNFIDICIDVPTIVLKFEPVAAQDFFEVKNCFFVFYIFPPSEIVLVGQFLFFRVSILMKTRSWIPILNYVTFNKNSNRNKNNIKI